MTVKELMELTGETRFNFVKILLRDCLTEMQMLTNENVLQYTTDLVNDQKGYDLPSNMIQVRSVKIKNADTGYYGPINRLIDTNIKEK